MTAQRASSARRLAYAVGICLAGAALALFAVSRVWSVQVTARPGLTDLRVEQTGSAQAPWLPALALVGLAGAGALLATRGWPRRSVGLLLVLAGAGLAAGALAVRAGLDPGSAGAGAAFWPPAAGGGGVLVAMGGVWALRRGHGWPAMGRRYERPAAAHPPKVTGGPGAAPPDQRKPAGPVDARSAWEALDRGDDPTVS